LESVVVNVDVVLLRIPEKLALVGWLVMMGISFWVFAVKLEYPW